MALAHRLLAWLTGVAFALAMLGATVDDSPLRPTGARAHHPTHQPCRRADSVEDAGSEGGDALARTKATTDRLAWDCAATVTELVADGEQRATDVAQRVRSVGARGPPSRATDVARA
ncbi:MAG: hypothetical protein U0168_23860 [Nannocystaceae bacterium]